MTKKELDKAWRDASVQEVLSDRLVLTQHKGRHGVCIIPEKQDTAARAIVAHLGREVTQVTGSKRGDLRYSFAPPLTEEEVEALDS